MRLRSHLPICKGFSHMSCQHGVCGRPRGILEMAHLVWSIMLRPKAVVEEEISRQGILPTVAPVKPYTLLALTCAAHQLGMSTDTMY